MSTEDSEGVRTSSAVPVYPHKELTEQVIGAAIEVHRELGFGFLEKVYENAFQIELKKRNLPSQSQVQIPATYKDAAVGTYVADVIVDDSVLCEIKAVDAITSIHQSQVIHYLKATGLKVGLILNFGASKLQVRRLIY